MWEIEENVPYIYHSQYELAIKDWLKGKDVECLNSNLKWVNIKDLTLEEISWCDRFRY